MLLTILYALGTNHSCWYPYLQVEILTIKGEGRNGNVGYHTMYNSKKQTTPEERLVSISVQQLAAR